MRLVHGERVGRQARLRPGASAIIFDSSRQKVLLTRRSDNGRCEDESRGGPWLGLLG